MPLSERQMLLERLALVREELCEAVQRCDGSMLDWAPAAGMRSVRGQLLEIAANERILLAWLRGRVYMEFREAEEFGPQAETLDGLNTVLSDLRSETLAYVESLSDAELTAETPFPAAWWEALRRPAAPRVEALRGLAMHEYYHTGQLVSYLWARGDDPYKW